MRVRVILTLALGLVIAPPIPARAQETETLRREIEQLKRQLETTQQQYQQAIEALTQRLQRLETRPQVAAAPASGQSGGPAGREATTRSLPAAPALPDLGALTEAVGGDLVEVDTLARADQNPHDFDTRPSLMVKLRRADLLVRNGVDGDPWVEPLVRRAGNGRLAPSGPGHLDVSRGIQVLGVPQGPVDRSRGDVHPEGNPHFTLDPGNAAIVTANIVERLARLAPEHRATLETRRREWLAQLDAAIRRWQETLAPYRGARVVTYHDTLVYFLDRFGLVSAGTVEDRPGIPPSPAHVADLIHRMKSEQVRVVIYEPWADRKLVERIARETGAQAVGLATAVGATKEATSYLHLFEFNVSALARALR
jgi:zinc/manganese transport system substrate-binding protein